MLRIAAVSSESANAIVIRNRDKLPRLVLTANWDAINTSPQPTYAAQFVNG
jgi:hypothetical protein